MHNYRLNVLELNLTFLVLKYVQKFIRIYIGGEPTCACTLCTHLHFPCALSHHEKVLHETLVCSFVEVLTLSCEPEEQVYILSSIFRPNIGLQLNKYDCYQR